MAKVRLDPRTFMEVILGFDDGVLRKIGEECGPKAREEFARLVKRYEELLNKLAERLGFRGAMVLVSVRGLYRTTMASGAKVPLALNGVQPILVHARSSLATLFHELCHHVVARECFGGDHELAQHMYREGMMKVDDPFDHPEEALCEDLGNAIASLFRRAYPRLYEAVNRSGFWIAEAVHYGVSRRCGEFMRLVGELSARVEEAMEAVPAVKPLYMDTYAVCRAVEEGYRKLGLDVREVRKRLSTGSRPSRQPS